jgi:uncharacterized membrane protein
MIQNPLFLIAFLLLIEVAVLYLAGHARFKKYFQFLPAVFWIYFLPMLASTVGIIDPHSFIYKKISTHLLPASLFLLLVAVDIHAIMRLGKPALLMFFAGSLGIMIGTPVVFFIFKNWIGPDFWSGFGALSASWTGGSANMIAVKEAVGTPDPIFSTMQIVDTIVPYVWMGVLVSCAGMQAMYDRWNRSDPRILDQLLYKVRHMKIPATSRLQIGWIVAIVIIGLIASGFSQFAARFLPEIKDVISSYTWVIIIVSILGLSFSLTPVKKLEESGSTQVGYFILYFVLASIGARASLADIGSTVLVITAGFIIVIIHAAITMLTARWIGAPMFLAVVSSQANLGGVASAPIVAEIYQPGFASVGLLLAILGNIVGTYIGILTAHLCRFVAGL